MRLRRDVEERVPVGMELRYVDAGEQATRGRSRDVFRYETKPPEVRVADLTVAHNLHHQLGWQAIHAGASQVDGRCDQSRVKMTDKQQQEILDQQ